VRVGGGGADGGEGEGQCSAVQFYTHNSNDLIFQFYSVRALLWKICLKYLLPRTSGLSPMEGKLIHYQELLREYLLEFVIKKKKKGKCRCNTWSTWSMSKEMGRDSSS
jgi:hypothetical protein